ncbi:coiled-coil domain-containing protein 34-like isoform X3 [Hypanus sabinus]|uniref:coiled-coil domain-containing protein 34-like isoform X3 n=1 Tax=Hypanus sabinus TaxID=79690 RepID=UPI0028C42FEE|nr:coiled-coil domain-containing protein 34-like isoform X3 [Hypanus sabinus]
METTPPRPSEPLLGLDWSIRRLALWILGSGRAREEAELAAGGRFKAAEAQADASQERFLRRMSSESSEEENMKIYSQLNQYQRDSRLENEIQVKSCELSSSSGSTSSLLSPIYHESYESEDEENESLSKQTDELSRRNSESTPSKRVVSFSKTPVVSTPSGQKKSRLRTCARKAKQSEEEEQHLKEVELTAWEAWLIKKAKEERSEVQKKSQQEVILKQAKLKEQEELQRKKARAEEEHRHWVQKKNEKEKLEKEKKLQKEQEEKNVKEQERERAVERASKTFQEWLKKKKLQEMEIKKQEKNAEEKKIAESQERREKADKVFQEWLEKVKSRPRTVPSSLAYANGKLTGYYDGSSYPAPSYFNPIPWKPIPVPCSEDNVKKITSKEKVKPKSTSLYIPHSNVAFRPKDNLVVGNGWRKAR